jgi:hypothetical protein
VSRQLTVELLERAIAFLRDYRDRAGQEITRLPVGVSINECRAMWKAVGRERLGWESRREDLAQPDATGEP